MKTYDEDFKKSSFSVVTHCVDVKRQHNRVLVRDTKNPDGGTLVFNHNEWDAFVKGVKDNQFDV